MIKKGLKVIVLAGKDKKKEGEVIEIDRSNNRAKIKDINIQSMYVDTINAFMDKVALIGNLDSDYFLYNSLFKIGKQ